MLLCSPLSLTRPRRTGRTTSHPFHPSAQPGLSSLRSVTRPATFHGNSADRQAGVDVRRVAGRLGHSDPSVRLLFHSHALEERDRAAAAVGPGDLLGGSAREGELSRSNELERNVGGGFVALLLGLLSGLRSSVADEAGSRRNDDCRPVVHERFTAAGAALGRAPRFNRPRSHVSPLTRTMERAGR